MKKVSILVPVYNAKNTILPLLGNLMNQTIEDYEVLLIDDQSSDGSYELLQECCRQFPKIARLFRCDKNSGPGGARNLGLAEAKGEYLAFADADDLMDVQFCEKLYQKAKEGNYDLVDTGFYYEEHAQSVLLTEDLLTGDLDVDKRKGLICTGGYLWSKLIRRACVEECPNGPLRFREGVILEDSDFLNMLYASIKRVGTVKEVLYLYHANENSSSHEDSYEKYLGQICTALIGNYERLSALENYRDLQEAIEFELWQFYSFGVNVCVRELMRMQKKENEFSKEEYKARLEQIESSLREIRTIKNQVISGSMKTNPYVKEKIAKEDQLFMERNDTDELIHMYNHEK